MPHPEPRRIRVHGHRGARARFPENTLPGFEYAIEQGVDALELDLAVTSDNVIVVSHDPILHEPLCTSPGKRSAVIRQLTLAEVRQWDCGALRNPRFPTQRPIPGTRMPTLDEIFELAGRGRFCFDVEVKSLPQHPELSPQPEEFARLVLQKIREHRIEDRVTVLSFDFRVLVAMRALAPAIRLSALTEADPRAFAAIAAEAADAEVVSPDFHLVTGEKVAAAHAAGLQMVPWTVNQPADWDRMIAAGVDAIVSDDPGQLIAHLKKRGLR